MVRVAVRAGSTVSRVDVWAGTRTQAWERLVTGRPYRSAGQHWLDDARTRWQPAYDLPLGEVVTTCRGREPGDRELFFVTEEGLQPISRADAWRIVDPGDVTGGLAQMQHDDRAEAAGLPREMTRFIGAHTLRDGVHQIGNSYYFAVRCTAKQAYFRRATRAEVEALGEPGARAQLVPCM
ncbi:hypothetical protein [Methylorubrum thiocyanatum]|uniref:hypothetical protein n=1 Tax=Methylorubrum thiocyanatum TaxID=47958 RepID=UPI0035C7B381